MIGRALPADTDTAGYKAAMTAATRAYAQYLTAPGFNPLPLQSTWREGELAASVGSPSLAALWAAWKLDIAYQWVTTRVVIIGGAVAAVAAIAGMAVGLAQLAAVGACSALVAAPASVTYSRVLSVSTYNGDTPPGYVVISNAFPYGGVDVEVPTITKGAPYGARNHNLTVFVTYYAATAAELPSYQTFSASLSQTGATFGNATADDDEVFFTNTAITLAPPGGVDAASRCLGAALLVRSTAYAMTYTISSSSVLVNIDGNFGDLVEPLINARAAFAAINVTTQAAPVYLSNIFLEGLAPIPAKTAYPSFGSLRAPDLVVISKTGDVFLSKVTASGISVMTSGTIHSNTVLSSVIHQCGQAACGDVRYTATGDGRIAHTAILGGSALYFATDRGSLVVANAATLFSSTFTITTGSGNIVLSNLLEAFGNDTLITSTGGGNINMASCFINRAIVSTVGAGKASVTFDFMGAPTPPADDTSLVVPWPPNNYSLPLLDVTTERGDISVIGAGGSPTGDFADVASLDCRSTLGNVKVEVNGDGINAPYSVASDRGTETVEIDGKASPLTGQLGDNPGSGRNYVRLRSSAGDVQLSLMAKPY